LILPITAIHGARVTGVSHSHSALPNHSWCCFWMSVSWEVTQTADGCRTTASSTAGADLVSPQTRSLYLSLLR
jgi:hypothetical protein